jgi:hypothetical protein
MPDKPKILYVSTAQNKEYAKKISWGMQGYDRIFIASISPDDILDGLSGVILIGTYYSIVDEVFSGPYGYFNFLKKANEKGIKVAAALKKGSLPRDNEGIDYVISDTVKRMVRGIGEEFKEKLFDVK